MKQIRALICLYLILCLFQFSEEYKNKTHQDKLHNKQLEKRTRSKKLINYLSRKELNKDLLLNDYEVNASLKEKRLKDNLKKLIGRRKLQFQKYRRTKNKELRKVSKVKLYKIHHKIKQYRQKILQKTALKSKQVLLKTNQKNLKSSKEISNNLSIARQVTPAEMALIHEKCKNSECTQLCSLTQLNTVKCLCHRGFRLNSNDNKTCEDIDECVFANCEYKCKNIVGGYHCECPRGKKLNYDKHSCIDINECFLNHNHGPCQDKCTNSLGSFSCSCDNLNGTRLSLNNKTCLDIDECDEQSAKCSHNCYNTYNSYICGCPEGMILSENEFECTDVNECLENPKLCKKTTCINTIGSYFCLEDSANKLSAITCNQMHPINEGYVLCDRNQTRKVILKGITEREHLLNIIGTICTFYTKLHAPINSFICNNQGDWVEIDLKDFPQYLN